MPHPAVNPETVRRFFLLFCCAAALPGPAPAQVPSQNGTNLTDIARDLERVRAMQNDEWQRRTRETEMMSRDLNDGWIEYASRDRQSPVYLPPPLPVLGAPPSALPSLPYPAELADFAGETFFMAYGSLQHRLNPAQLRQIKRYRVARDQLTRELRAALAEAAPLPSPASPAPAARLADRQEPALRQLEADAEAIRAGLAAADEGLALTRLRDKLDPGHPLNQRDFFPALLASQFHPGFSLEQRQLLLEVALESLSGAPAGAAPPDSFLPAPARLRWPAGASGEIVTLGAEFRSLREALRHELLQTVAPAGAAPSAAVRTKQYSALAAQQAPGFAALHQLAERIRPAAVGLVWPDQPTASDFPADLVRQVGSAVAHKNALQARTLDRFQKFSREFSPIPLRLTFTHNVPVITIATADPDAEPDQELSDVLSRLQPCNQELADGYRVLATEMNAARIALQSYLAARGGETAPPAGKLSAQLAETYAREETWRQFTDYRTAVLTPGLSPAQRRLLINAAFRDLEKLRLQSVN